LRRYLVAAVLSLPAGAIVGLVVGAFFSASGNPDWRADATASEAWRFILGFVLFGFAVGGVAAVGSVVGVVIGVRKSRRDRIAYAGLGATVLLLAITIVCALFSFLLFLVGIPVAIVAGLLAALGASIAEPRIPDPRYG